MIGDCGLTMQNINGTTLLDEFTNDEGEQTVIYGIGREESMGGIWIYGKGSISGRKRNITRKR